MQSRCMVDGVGNELAEVDFSYALPGLVVLDDRLEVHRVQSSNKVLHQLLVI